MMIQQLSETLQASTLWQTVAAGESIFQEGEAANVLFFLESGRVRLLQYTQDGKSIDHYGVGAGEFFAEVVLFLDTYGCSAIAEESSRVAAIPKAAFLEELLHSPSLATALLSQMSRRLHFSKILLELRSIRTARERVLRYLQVMIPLMGEPEQFRISFDRPFRAIAENLGISPEAFSRALRQLQKEGVIDRNRRIITLCEH
jgi:CRP/FNR family transcriptional regulator, dissimilatory nitrate respiration regulator